MTTRQEVTVGIGGAAGDGLDKTGDTIAKTCSRLGLYLSAYNSYQSVIRGGHIWLRVRIAEEKVYSHGDHLNLLIALNQDSIERHAREVNSGGAIIYNSDKLKCDSVLVGDGVVTVPLPIAELTKPLGRLQPVMQNTVATGAMLYLLGLDFEMAASVLADTFKHKGEAVVEQNINVARAGYDHARERFVPLGYEWNFTRIRRPFITGNEAFALGAVAAGCKFYSAYPMTPASSILHWMANHGAKCGVVVKQCEDELAVVNVAIGAGHAGVRAMCGTSGGGFALMTEAIGMAGMIEAPVVVIEVQRGGPSTGIPTKTEQADLNQVFGASQGDYPRVIIAPTDTTDCYYTAVEAHNLAEKYQLPVTIISDLLLSEHPETIEADAFRHDVPIERGEIVDYWPEDKGQFKRYAFTKSGISPRVLPGTEGGMYVAATDDHDEEGIVISDVFTVPPVRRKIQEKRMHKVDAVLSELVPPQLEGPHDADVTLIGWGSTSGVIREAIVFLTQQGIRANHLQIKYLHPFHSKEVTEILRSSKRTICVECNYTGQFARHLRAETGFSVSDLILKYDGEPFEPHHVVQQVRAILEGRSRSLDVTMDEAREIAYHYIRVHLADKVRPARIEQVDGNDGSEPLWLIELVGREHGEKEGELRVGKQTGSIFQWQPAVLSGGARAD
ncbi:MAG TPA: 2-oxoacid:acceptor oxidoreductase subunit alpha [Blastocatellia bacterium]|nr:2-oxoacid:acceptor oxidoreductase subunit alpha [Blastocatellia bacterium]